MDQVCKKCRGSGWLPRKKDGRDYVVKCECRISESFLLKCRDANLPKRFLDCTLDHYYPDAAFPSQGIAKKAMEKFIEDYPAVLKGILLQGPVGVGKTRLLCTIATALIRRIPRIDILYIDWNDFNREIRANMGQYDTINDLISRLAGVDLLLFDELGASAMTPWFMENVYYIFNRRYNDQKITLGATNYPDAVEEGQETLKQRLGERIRSRLYEMTDIIAIKGKDMRKL